MSDRRPRAAGSSCTLLRPRWRCVTAMFLAVGGTLAGGQFPPAARAAEQRDGLVLEYRFEGSAADSSGSKHDGTPRGTPQFVPGKLGQCVQLDGQQDYIDTGTTLADLGQTFTIECWVNPADRQNLHADIFGNHSHGGFGFAVEQDADNTICFAGAYGVKRKAVPSYRTPKRERSRIRPSGFCLLRRR